MADFMIACPACGGFLTSDSSSENIKMLPYNFMLDGNIYEYKGEIIAPEVYEKVKKGHIPNVAPISIPEFTAYFTPILNSGKDILHIDFSQNYSPNCKYANDAAEVLLKKYPERKITVIDSKRLGLGIFAIAKEADKLLKSDKSFDETAKAALKLTETNIDLLIARDLLFLKEKKYISGFQKKAGELKQTEVILSFNAEGALTPILKTGYPLAIDITFKRILSDWEFDLKNYYIGCESSAGAVISCADHSLILESHIIKGTNSDSIQSPDIFTISKVGLNSFEILCFNLLS